MSLSFAQSHSVDKLPHPFHGVMEQLCFDLNELLPAQSEIGSGIPAAPASAATMDVKSIFGFEPDENMSGTTTRQQISGNEVIGISDQNQPWHGHDGYVRMVIGMLLTCSEDLAQVKNEELRENARAWLLEEVPSPLTFQICARLLEEELKFQSNGQVDIPAIEDNRRMLACWIIDDPMGAKRLLNNYHSLFSKSNFSDLEDISERQGKAAPRNRLVH